jgi:hypothetical protein
MNTSSLTGSGALLSQPLLDSLPPLVDGSSIPTIVNETKDTYVGPTAGPTAQATTSTQIDHILSNPALSQKEKQVAIDDLRKQLGLSKKEMKEITRSMAQSISRQIEVFKASGVDTAEKAAKLQELESKKSVCDGMYKAGGCAKKAFRGIGNVAKTIGSVALKVAVPMASMIPGAGPFISAGLSVASKYYDKALGAADSAVDKVVGWAEQGMDYVQKGAELYKNVTQTTSQWISDAKSIFGES